jgi:hypothetical protein
VYKIKSENAGWAEGTGNVAGSNPVTANNGGSTWSHLSYNSDPGSAVEWFGGQGLGTEGTGGYEGVTPDSSTPIATFTFDNGGVANGGPGSVNLTIPKDIINEWIADPANNAGLYIKLRSSQLESTEHAIVFRSKNFNLTSAPTLTFESGVLLIPGDFNGDGNVDGLDFVVWQNNFPKASAANLSDGDADGDGDVDGADFVVWQTNFPFSSSSATTPIPEPHAGFVMLSGAVGLAWVMRSICRRRRCWNSAR